MVAKHSDEGSGVGADQRDPAAELEKLVDADMNANKVERSKAYERVLRARPDLNAVAKQRDDKLRKAAQAFGDGYGTR